LEITQKNGSLFKFLGYNRRQLDEQPTEEMMLF